MGYLIPLYIMLACSSSTEIDDYTRTMVTRMKLTTRNLSIVG